MEEENFLCEKLKPNEILIICKKGDKLLCAVNKDTVLELKWVTISKTGEEN